MEGQPPDRSRPYPDDLLAAPRERAGIRPHFEDPRGSDEDAGERRAGQPLDLHPALERFPLATIIVPSDIDVEGWDRHRVPPPGRWLDPAAQEDEAGARREHR